MVSSSRSEILSVLMSVLNDKAALGDEVTGLVFDSSLVPEMAQHAGWDPSSNAFLLHGVPAEFKTLEETLLALVTSKWGISRIYLEEGPV